MKHETGLEAAINRAKRAVTGRPTRRDRLASIDLRIVVMGTRGKSTLVEWLHQALVERGLDTYAKVTGEQPYSLYNGQAHPIDRTEPTMLYETAREIRRFDPAEAIVVENHGIREYTSRLVNASYVDPTLVVLTNVRRDHLDTLGSDAFEVARAQARAVPAGTPVITAERNEVLAEYLRRELDRRDAPLTRVGGSGDDPDNPGDELVALLDATLEAYGLDPLDDRERRSFGDRLRVRWTVLPGGRVYDASNVNDVESTEVIRRLLQDDDAPVIQPLVYFREDRPGRTEQFIDYFDWLADRGHIEQVRCVGAHRQVAEHRLDVPVVFHDETVEPPVAVLDAALSDPWPLMLTGNAVPSFMVELAEEIDERRLVGTIDLPQPPEPSATNPAPPAREVASDRGA